MLILATYELSVTSQVKANIQAILLSCVTAFLSLMMKWNLSFPEQEVFVCYESDITQRSHVVEFWFWHLNEVSQGFWIWKSCERLLQCLNWRCNRSFFFLSVFCGNTGNRTPPFLRWNFILRQPRREEQCWPILKSFFCASSLLKCL